MNVKAEPPLYSHYEDCEDNPCKHLEQYLPQHISSGDLNFYDIH